MALLVSDPAPPRSGAALQGIIWFGGLVIFFFMADIIVPDIPPSIDDYRKAALLSSWVGLGGCLGWAATRKARETGRRTLDWFLAEFWNRSPGPLNTGAPETANPPTEGATESANPPTAGEEN
ncbi:hypothetical protein [Streptomyces sp. C]|uniref:hypothetical protein n=1 Tax=Streptomyces sp. C TaxID=253839 RepID=UPI0001DEF7C5|nr:hypothetical protein [Streptomyces sp. C]EFL17624.1 predicted protein [Streptomyces sp. C]